MRLRELIERWKNSLLIRLIILLIGAIATFLQYLTAGWTLLFWLLSGVAILAAISIAIPLVVSKWREQQATWANRAEPLHAYHSRVKTLTDLIDWFETVEKAKALREKVGESKSIRIVAILPVEMELGVIINIGQIEDVRIGTRLLVYRKDRFTSEGQHIEQLIGAVQVTYVHCENDCSQAKIVDRRDREFWDQIEAQVQKAGNVTPPSNFAIPDVPAELAELTVENIVAFRRYLQLIRTSLTDGKTP